jgi:hypothetical protein
MITYVATAPLLALAVDLKMFLDDALSHAAADAMGTGAPAISAAWWLTDLFAGFEIWTGSDAANLTATFTADVR